MDAPRADSTQALARSEQPFRAFNIDLNDPQDRHFADYELLEKIGGGGMGVVYRARQLSLDREVALKLLASDPFAGEDMVARFRDEARHAGRLQHPNIIPIFEIGTHENLYYFSMGLVRGPTLGDWLIAAPRSPRVLATMLRTICEAVEYAHQVGILHLDLKPGNVLIDERGAPQVGDFGLAHGISEAAAGKALAAGTPAFMAPEQTQRKGATLTPRTDVWGLGAILCEMLTGQPPFVGENSADTLRRVVSQPLIAPIARNPQVPADLDAICRHCLAKEPAARYPSARAMADDLQRFLDGRPVSVRDQGLCERIGHWRRRDPRAAALALSLLLALVIGLGATSWLWVQAEANRRLAQETLWDARRDNALEAQARGDPLAELPGLVDNIAEAEALGDSEEALRDRLRVGLLLAHSPRQIASVQFDQEGRSLSFAEGGALILAGLRNGELVAIEVEGQRERWRVRPEFPPTPWGASFVGRSQATPDGGHALLWPSGSSGVARPDVSNMQRIDIIDGSLLAPPPAFADFSDMSFAPDGARALLHDRHGGWQLWAVAPWRPLGARFLRPGTRYCLLTAGAVAACSEPGFKHVALVQMDTGASRGELAFASGAEISAWSGSADGRWLALGSANGEMLLHELGAGSSHQWAEAGEGAIGELAFGGGLLTISSFGGSVRLFDLQTRTWLSRALRGGGPRLNSAEFDGGAHRLFANDGRAVLWQLPSTLDRSSELPPTSVMRHRGVLIGMHSTAMLGAKGLAASFGSEGEIKLFRLPPTPWDWELRELMVSVSADLQAPVAMQSMPDANPAYLAQASADGRFSLVASGAVLWLLRDRQPAMQLDLDNSAQYLLVHPRAPLALVASIEPDTRLKLRWRTLDLETGNWPGAPFFSDGLLDGVRLDRAGERLVWWQGRSAQVRGLRDGRLLGQVELPPSAQQITDASVLGLPGQVLLATSEPSMLQPGTVQKWQVDAQNSQLLERIDTPSAHSRIFDLGEHWFGHGPRVALYRAGQRIELAELGGDWSEAAAISADLRWAAVGHRDSIRLFDLKHAQQLLAPLRLSLPPADILAEVTFSADGQALLARSHYGRHASLPLLADTRSVAILRNEALDLVPSREGRAPAASVAERAARDPGEPPPPIDSPAAVNQRPAGASAAQIDLRPRANVWPGHRFQGSRRGLGITDSASWPRGLLRLRGIDFDLGPALQLAPTGTSLGAALFPDRSGPIALPERSARVHLLLTNQIGARPAGLRLDWLDTGGTTLASSELLVPSAWDGTLHSPERAHQPAADVALIVRTSESRAGGGGSPQLFVYLIEVAVPTGIGTIAALELHAPASAPLLLGMTVSAMH